MVPILGKRGDHHVHRRGPFRFRVKVVCGEVPRGTDRQHGTDEISLVFGGDGSEQLNKSSWQRRNADDFKGSEIRIEGHGLHVGYAGEKQVFVKNKKLAIV